MNRKQLVLMGEGDGEKSALPILVTVLLKRMKVYDVYVGREAWKLGGYGKLQKREFENWRKKIKAASKEKNFGGCLLLLDGDAQATSGEDEFCVKNAAIELAEAAREVGAGSIFSVATVFAYHEFESWLLAGVPSLHGKAFSDGRKLLKDPIEEVPSDPERPRNAKGWFSRNLVGGYNAARDQAELVRLIDWQMVSEQNLRSFSRMEHAVEELVTAIRAGQHIVSPIDSESVL